jgi:transposase, IS5 family
MKQQTLAMAADIGFEQFRRPTKRDVFLSTMDKVMPWQELCSVVQPYYANGEGGRPPVGLERMLRMRFVQHWFHLADEACEEALYDSASLRSFVGIDLGRERVPDATTLLKFRRLLQTHQLGQALLAKVGEVLQSRGLKVGAGTIVDAPSSARRPRRRTRTRSATPRCTRAPRERRTGSLA